jgi:hypothetical protein
VLREEGEYSYGDSPADVVAYFAQRSHPALPVTNHRQAICSCGSEVFQVDYDQEETWLARYCTKCDSEVVMFADEFTDAQGSSPREVPNPELIRCLCDGDEFEVIGVTVPFSHDLKDLSAHTFYLGLRCISCGCLGEYASWHPRYNDSNLFLAML